MPDKQLGNGLLREGAPKFPSHVVVGGTWKEKDNMDILRTDDGDSKVHNYTGWKPGADCSCDLVIKQGEAPVKLKKLDVLEESAPGTRKFIVIDVETSSFGGMPLKQAVQLAYHEGFDPTVLDGDGEAGD